MASEVVPCDEPMGCRLGSLFLRELLRLFIIRQMDGTTTYDQDSVAKVVKGVANCTFQNLVGSFSGSNA